MAQRKKGNPAASLIIIILLFVALLLVRQCKKSNPAGNATQTEQRASWGFNRNPSAINYSKHARCRMACRHIDESEVQDILANGKINYAKSEIGDNPDCERKYALEGTTKDNQRVRIIFAPCHTGVTVVTVIDLDTEWACDCN